MKITILTLFPDLIKNYLATSIMGRASKKGLVEYQVVDIRNFGEGKHQIVDDRPFGGGVGLVLKADILAAALKSIPGYQSAQVILTSASGTPFKQIHALNLSSLKHLILICGHYEGVDQRFIDKYINQEFSIGDYVLTGGELPALAITDSIVRLVPGVLEKEEATIKESFTDQGLLEHPQYTRPAVFEGKPVPEVLISGNHQEIKKWRHLQAQAKTKATRPDLT